MSRMRWTNNPDDRIDWSATWAAVWPYLAWLAGISVLLTVIGFVTLSIHGCVKESREARLIQNDVYQSNHKQLVKLKKDVITCIHLEAKWDQKWNFKTCEDYDLVTIQNVKTNSGRYSNMEGVEIWLRVKKSFILEMTYKKNTKNEEDVFFYVSLQLRE